MIFSNLFGFISTPMSPRSDYDSCLTPLITIAIALGAAALILLAFFSH